MKIKKINKLNEFQIDLKAVFDVAFTVVGTLILNFKPNLCIQVDFHLIFFKPLIHKDEYLDTLKIKN